jgi:hypothetical protein
MQARSRLGKCEGSCSRFKGFTFQTRTWLILTRPDEALTLGLATSWRGTDMLKFLGGTIGIIFLIGLAVVIGILALIF